MAGAKAEKRRWKKPLAMPRCLVCESPLNLYGGWWEAPDHREYVSLSDPVWRCPNGCKVGPHALPPSAASRPDSDA